MLKNEYIETHNKKFIKKKLIEYHNRKYILKESKSDFFDNINNCSLDFTQRKCILTDDKYVLIVAGAGSGKSLTIVGKVKYLIEVKRMNPRDILCISFTNESTTSLKNKLKNYDVDIKTFHKLGLDILENNGLKFNLCETDTLDKIITTYFDNILPYNLNLMDEIIKYLIKYIKLTSYDNNINIYDTIINYLELNNVKYMNNKNIYLVDYKIFIKISSKKDNNINLPYKAYEDGILLELLSKELEKRKINLIPNYKKIENKYSIYFTKIKKIINTFITLFKSGNYSITYIDKIIKENEYEVNEEIKRRNIVLLKMIKDIYNMYQDYLLRNDMCDFDDLINKSTEIIDDGFIKNYKYIIIDEYQDTSVTKYLLLKKIIDKTGSKLLAVGDDFQSIYRFTGCNLDIFIDFNKYYPNAKILKIEKTYRNSQELIDLAGKFILKNERQINKRLVSDKHLNKPIKIYYYEDIKVTIKRILDILDNDILILARNNKDINLILDKDIKLVDGNIVYRDKKIRFLTVHKSKGLEASYVIVINISNDILGFPCKMVDDPILKYLNKNKDYYPYEEERRLFYVAITRSKNNVYLLVPKKNPSNFIREIANDDSVEVFYT